jgi:hypothetical protein
VQTGAPEELSQAGAFDAVENAIDSTPFTATAALRVDGEI